MSLSARRAWIEIILTKQLDRTPPVALRKESVDRNMGVGTTRASLGVVALRKESVDRNLSIGGVNDTGRYVALRKESVDRNNVKRTWHIDVQASLSARRAWIEIKSGLQPLMASLSRSPQGERG